MPRKRKKKKEEIELENQTSNGMAFLITFLSIIGFIIYLVLKNKTEYTKFYAKQSLVVFIASVITGIIGEVVSWIPVLGGIIKTGLSIIILVLWILSWVYALSGKMKKVPLVGNYADNIRL